MIVVIHSIAVLFSTATWAAGFLMIQSVIHSRVVLYCYGATLAPHDSSADTMAMQGVRPTAYEET